MRLVSTEIANYASVFRQVCKKNITQKHCTLNFAEQASLCQCVVKYDLCKFPI